MMTRIKICGITKLHDALTAADLGVDAVGFVFVPSKRRISPAKAREIITALPPFITTAGIFMNTPLRQIEEIADYTGIDIIQLHGDETPEYCQQITRRVVKRLAIVPDQNPDHFARIMRIYSVSAWLIDPGAGSGEVFDWRSIQGIKGRLIIAGGLTPENVRQAIELLSPYGVDVSTGVETIPGEKDYDKLQAFVQEVRSCYLPA
jgi:phosphoribosylanthranilate isomerase